jgi:hypothetical protein
MRQPNAGISAPAKPVRVKVKAHTRAAPAEPSHVVRPPKPAAAKPVKVRSTAPPQTPDSRDNNRAARHPKPVTQPSPDAQDVTARSQRVQAFPGTTSTETVPQRKIDQQYAADVQQEMRAKVAARRHPVVKVKTGHGPGHLLASIQPGALVHAIANVDAGGSLPVFSGIAKVAGRGLKDAEEMAVTTPSSVAKLASDAVHHPERVPGELAKPYVQLAKHPIKTLSEHPLQTALMVAPAIRMPGRTLGKVARVAGKQTLERPPAALPGTALKVARTGSRDAVVRAFQSRADRKNPTPTATVKDVQERVDARFDANRHLAQRAEAVAVRATKRATKGQPKAVRREAVAQAREHAREQALQDAEVRFAREFGANVRLSTGAAERELAQRQRATAVQRVTVARKAVQDANAQHGHATTGLNKARDRAKRLRIATLERQRRDAQRDLAQALRVHASARDAQGVAKGRSEVLSRNVGGTAGGYGVRLAGEAADAAAQHVANARATIRALDDRIATEHKRLVDIQSPEHQVFFGAVRARGRARAELANARAGADIARTQHIQAKQGMTDAALVSPAGAGRLFTHRADAANVARKLNEQGHELKQGTSGPVRFQLHEPNASGAVVSAQRGGSAAAPLEFTVRQVGDKWVAVPKVASHRMYPSGGPDSPLSHASVGASKSTMAKVMRTSRQAFTGAVLPFSLKWLGGQGGEAGLRSVVAGAGPADWLRIGKIVKQMNADMPGSGDEFRAAITGGHFDLTGPARDFADGKKTLAEEFAGTSLRQPAAAATYLGHTLPARAIRKGFAEYSHVVFNVVNGAIEQNARRAMAGQAVKNLGLLDHHLIGLTDAAIKDAADKLQHTENQVAAVRALNRMYGKYQGFSPEMRSLLLHWTPFLPWYLNVATFLFKVLPVDHPVQTALLADINAAEEQWRKDHHLSLLQGNHVPDFLLGGYPNSKGGIQRLAHYTPFGVGSDVTGAAGALALPQFEGPILNALGVDWKGSPLTVGGSHGKPFSPTQKAIRAAVTALEEQVPGVAQAGAVSGVTPRYVDKDTPAYIKTPGEVLKGYLPTTASRGAASSGSAIQPLTGGGSSGSSGPVKAVRVKPVGAARGGRVQAVRVKPVRVR